MFLELNFFSRHVTIQGLLFNVDFGHFLGALNAEDTENTKYKKEIYIFFLKTIHFEINFSVHNENFIYKFYFL